MSIPSNATTLTIHRLHGANDGMHHFRLTAYENGAKLGFGDIAIEHTMWGEGRCNGCSAGLIRAVIDTTGPGDPIVRIMANTYLNGLSGESITLDVARLRKLYLGITVWLFKTKIEHGPLNAISEAITETLESVLREEPNPFTADEQEVPQWVN